MNANNLERLAAQMGWLNFDFEKAIEEAEENFEKGKSREIQSSKDLHR
jgi:hypothetical protein